MIAATRPSRRPGKLLTASADGRIQSLERSAIASLFEPGDLVVANDAATIPASLHGTHQATGSPIEIRLAAFVHADDPTRFVAVAFGAGDHRTPTEDRSPPPILAAGDRLVLGPLAAIVERLIEHPRLIQLRFPGGPAHVFAGLAHHGSPIQYAHVPDRLELWDVWTSIAASPFAFEAPSAGFVLDWRTLARWQERGVRFAALTHAAGISSTGDPVLDDRLPLDEPYVIPEQTAEAIAATRDEGGSVIAIGTTVVRALESAAFLDGTVRAGRGVATGRIGPRTRIQVVDTILTGVHEPGESHFELLRAFTSDAVLHDMHDVATKRHYRTHEFGDSMLIERRLLSSGLIVGTEKVSGGGSVNHCPVAVESGSVERAIPGAGSVVPSNDSAQVGAHAGRGTGPLRPGSDGLTGARRIFRNRPRPACDGVPAHLARDAAAESTHASQR